jgi:hypothetical protein
MIGLIFEKESSPGAADWQAANTAFTNETGTPVVSIAETLSGALLGGTYTITFTASDPGVDAFVTVSAADVNNPNNGNTATVDLDGATPSTDLIPGLAIIFDDAIGFLDTWEAVITVGHDFGSLANFGAASGSGSTGIRVRARNTGDDVGANCKAEVATIVIPVAKVGQIFDKVLTFADSAVEKLDVDSIVSPYAITVENKAGAGAAITADIKVDGALVNVINLTDDSETTSEDLTVVDRYQITDGDLEDVVFQLSESILNTATANLLIFDAALIQIAADENGSPGTWGTADCVLTTTGQASGVIPAAGVAYFWIRILIPSGSFYSKSNPRPVSVRLYGEAEGSANWAD